MNLFDSSNILEDKSWDYNCGTIPFILGPLHLYTMWEKIALMVVYLITKYI